MALGSHLTQYPLIGTFRAVAVKAALLYLRFFARLALTIHKPTIFGIAGSVGKSTARNALSAILSSSAPTKVVEGNSETGIPLGILGLDAGDYSVTSWIKICMLAPFSVTNLIGTRYLVVEMGIDGPLPPKNMAYLTTIVKPDIAILLNETPAHVGNYESILPGGGKGISDSDRLDAILTYMTEDDGCIIRDPVTRLAITNADDPRIERLLIKNFRANPDHKLQTFGSKKTNDISYADYSVSPSSTTFTYVISGESRPLVINIHKYLLPKLTQSIFAAVILAVRSENISYEKIQQALKHSFTLPPSRSSVFEGIRNTTIIDSSYNANSASVLAFLELLKSLGSSDRSTAFLFGDMKELGSETEQEHELVRKATEGIVDYFYCVGPLTKQTVLSGVRKGKYKEVSWFENAIIAGEYLKKNLPDNTVILVKGSQQLEESIKYLLKNKEDAKELCRQDPFWEKSKIKRNMWKSL